MTDLSYERRKRRAEGDNAEWTVRDMLVYAIEQIDAGELDAEEAILVYRKVHKDVKPQEFSAGFIMANLYGSEAISMLEYRKHKLLHEMGGE